MRALGEVTNPTGRLPAKEFDNRFRFHTAARQRAAGMEAETPTLTGSDHALPCRCRDWGRDGLCGSQAKRLPSWPGPSASGWRPLIFHGAIVQRENSAFARRQRGFESHWLHHFRDATKLVCGGMAERLIAAVLKTAGGSRLPGVQIPLPPPCVAPQGPRSSRAHLEQQSRYPFPSLRMPGGCHVTLRAASIGEAAFLFPFCSRSPWRAGESR